MMKSSYGFALAAALMAVACADSYGGSAANPRGVQGPNPPRAAKAADAGAPEADTKTGESTDESDDDSNPTKPTDPQLAPRALEVAAYYAGYTTQTLPTSKLDLGGTVDELTHFSVVPQADGSLNDRVNMVFSENSLAVVNAAKAAKVRTTLCVGGAGSEAAFAAAAKDHRADLVTHIASFVNDRGYDGVDIDWEPLAAEDASNFVALIKELRAKLGAKTITAAVPVGSGALVAAAAGEIDRFHLMTYDLAGPYPGWVTWHNGALYNGGATFPSTGGKLPSVETAITDFVAAGIPASKVMLGIDHMGYAWKGGVGENGAALVAPRMSWSAPPTYQPIPFREIADKLLTPERAKWDDQAKTPFLAIDEAGTANDQFITYEDENSQREKVTFARNHGLAGVFVWDISASYRPTQAAPLALMQSLHTDAKAPAAK